MKRVHKGEFGYIQFERKWTIIRTCLYFAICIAVFVIGVVTTGSRKNLLTIVAVLGCLPACKSAVNSIMFFRTKGCSEALYNKIYSEISIKESSKLFDVFDLYMTSYKSNFDISHLTISGNTIIGITEIEKCNIAEAEKHIQEHLKQDGHKNFTVKIYDDNDKYISRLLQLEQLDITPLKIQDAVLEMLLSISL